MAATKGRQREAARNDRNVLDAARVVFATQGWDAPVAAVAERAGVGMGSLYRRYGSKTELLQRLCVLAMEQNIDAAKDSLAIDDPWTGLTSYIRACVGFNAGAFAPLAGTLAVTHEMLTTARRSQRLLTELLNRAQAVAAVRDDITATDIFALIEHFSRPSANPNNTPDDVLRARILTITIDGLRAPDASPLIGPTPTSQTRAGQWRTSTEH